MAKGFNLTAEINLRGPSNIKSVVSGIRKQLGNIGVNVNPSVSQADIKNIATSIRSRLTNINIPINVSASSTSIKSLARNIRSGLGNISTPVSITVSQRSLSAARRDINAQLGNIRANVNVVVNPASARSATALNANLTALNQTLNSITTSATSAATAIRDLSAAMRTAGGGANALSQINTSLNVVSNNSANASASMRQLGGEVENFGRQAGLAIRRFAAFTTVTSVFYGLGRSVQAGLSAFIEFDRQLVRIAQVTGDTVGGLGKLQNTISSLSQSYGVSSQELAGVSLTLAQAGLTAKETEQALKALARTALAPSFDNMNDTVEGSIALMRQFGISTNELESALGSVNSVAAKFAVEASDIIAAIQRTGGVFAAASRGVSEGTDALNEFVAVFTSVRATTRESAETIATGLRTIFTRIQRGDTIEALKDFGVNLTDVEGKFVGAYKAVELLSTGLSRLDPRDLRFSQIVEELGGFRQIGKVIPLIQQFSTAQQALNVAQEGSGSLAEDAAKGQLALAVQIAKVREEFLTLIRSVGDTSSFRTLVKLGLDLASSLIQVADAAKELIPLIGAFAAFRGAQSLTRFASGFIGGVRGTQPRGFAGGGYVPGSGNRDTVPAMLTPGEFVIRKKAVEKIGVGSLARINRNNGGPVPTQYFEDGGQVQRFGIGGSAKKGINWKSLSQGRGKKGSRGPRGRFDLPQPGDADFAKWQREIYAEYDADPSLPRVRHNGIPMPPEIAYANQLISEEVFGAYRRKKTGKLKKTPLGLMISAAKMPRGPRAPAGEMEKIMAGYQQSPEFRKEAGGAGSSLFSTLKGPLASFKKGGTFGGVIAPGSDDATKIKGALAKLLGQSSGQDAIKAKTALDKFDSFIAGATPEKSGHVAHFTWAMNQIFKKGIATFGRGGRAERGYIQKFAGGKKVKRPPIPVSDEMKENIAALQQTASKSILSQNRVGLAILKPPKTQFKDTSIPKSKIIKSVGSQYSELLKTSLANQSIVVDKEPLSQQAYTDFDNAIEGGLISGLDSAATSLSSKYPLPKTPVPESAKKSFLAGINNAAKGNLFEQVLSSMKNQGKWDSNADPQAPFDFVGGMGSAATLFPTVGSLKYVDAKAANVSDSSIALKIANQTLRDIGVVSGKKQPKQQLTQAETGILSDLSSRIPKDFNTSATAFTIKQKYGLSRGGLTQRGLKKSLEMVAKSGRTDEFVKEVLGSVQRNNLGGFIQKFSFGGNVKGISSDRARSAILGKQLSGAEMIKAARRAGYDIEELDNGLIQLSRNNKAMHTLNRAEASKLLGSMATGYAKGGMAQAPLIDDIMSASGTLLPRPSSAVAALIRAGGGAVDIDRTLKRTIGDKAYGMAKTPGQQTAALEKYFRDPQARLMDVKSAPLTSFGQELRAAIRSGQLQPNRLSIISKSLRTPGVAEYLSQLFGIPIANMVFTQGGSKQPAMDALRTKGPRANRTKRYASGGGVDTVPALLTPGEFVINKKAAARLGASKLHQLNKADKISGFNTGGEVGRVPTFSSGGDVQRFFFGGRASARPGAEATTSNLMISGNVATQLREMVAALQELGVASSTSADLLRRGGRASVEAANAAYEADILRMRVAGAPMDAVIQAETRLANMRRQAQTQVAAQRQLSGVGGAQLQVVDDAAQQGIQRAIQRAQAAGVDLNEAQRTRIEDVSYRRAAQAGGLSTAQTAGLSGNDLRQFINTAMGDPTTFNQMNRQFEARRRAELTAQYQSELGTTATRRQIRQAAERGARDAAAEANLRRQTLNQTRGAAGPGGTGAQRMQQGMFAASFALPMLAQMLAGDPSRATSSGGAAMSAGIQGGANALALGTMLSSIVPPGLPQVFVGLAAAAGAVAQGLIDARNASIEFEKNMASKKIEFALSDAATLFDKLSKDIKNVNVQTAIGEKLVEASRAAERSIEIQSNTAKAFWVNMIDAFASNGKEAAQRGQILERFGTGAYLSTTTIGQSFMGGPGTAEERANRNRSNFAMQMAPEQSREIASQFGEIANSANRLLEEKIRGGANIEDYLSSDEFKGLSQSIALSNAAIGQQVLQIRASTTLTDEQKKAQEQLIISTYAEGEARKRAAVISRELEMKQAQKATNQLARSLDRMFGNMEQAINKTNFALEKMSRDLDLVSASLTGQAKSGERSLQAINVLQNPRAYGAGEVNRARGQAAGLFGDSGNIIRGLLTLGDDIEANIMGSINRALRDSQDDSPGRIAIAVQKGVKDKLASLSLPKDVSDKLAREVSRALEEIRKEGDDQADFTQLEEKLQGLNQIIDSTTKAQEIAIKALETWQNALNSYSSSMNSLVDLQIDYQSRLRASTEILLEGQESLARALGRDISLESVAGRRNRRTAQQTGGPTTPQDIFRNINQLELNRTRQENASNIAAQRGTAGAKDFVDMQNNLRLTNVALRENFDALRNLAENSDVASAALGKIQEAQQRQQGRVTFIEKLVTSTPEELDNLNRSFIRLQNNMSGQVNTINNSVGAQRAYIEAIRGGSTAFEAMKAAQDAFANERRDTLSALNDLLPFLGGGDRANQIRANTLESMLAESGVGASPMFQDILNSLRNPELDPETQKAIALYEQANVLQVQANDFLAQITAKLGEQTAETAAKAIATALSQVVLTFKNAEQADVNRGLIPPQNRASGGIIYASKGAFAPRGTDTVPAMLTPGEFVVNKQATAKNLPLLKSINNQNFSNGGQVKYYAKGGLVSNFLSREARTLEDFQSSKESYLDPSDTKIISMLDASRSANKLQALPDAWYRSPDGKSLQTPDRSTVFQTSEGNINYDFNKLYPSDGKILPGIVNTKLTKRKRIGAFDANFIDGSNPGVTGLSTTVATDEIILGIEKDGLMSLSTKKIQKKDFDSYKEKINKIKSKIGKINWIQDAASPTLAALNSASTAGGYPDSVIRGVNADTFNPNGTGGSVLYYGPQLTTETKDYGAVWRWTTPSIFSLPGTRTIADVATIGNPVPNPDFINTPENEFKKLFPIKSEGPGGITKDSEGILKPNKIQDIINYHREQAQVINKAVALADNNFNDVDFADDEGVGKYKVLQESLSRLYNNASAYESFNDMSLFSAAPPFPSLAGAKSLTVTSNNAVSRSDIAKYIESLASQPDLKAGDVPTNNGNRIAIGLADALPAGLQNSVKKWVTKTEFDIFPEKGAGQTKNFPFLINANTADLGQPFIDRAAAAVMAQKDAIETSMVLDNNKVRVAVINGKSVDLPYSASYTKYSGPLWDAATNSLSDDPNKQLKDVFLPDSGPEKSVFANLDTTRSRLFKQGGAFDLNNTPMKVPFKSISNLIDLVRNNADQKLIDQEVQNIQRGSTLTFDHIGNFQGSLIKLEKQIGKEAFVGYSELADTPLDFGSFVAQGVIDYAKNLKQEAGIAAGKAQGAGGGAADVIGDTPMALRQLTQGALQIFGRRPIPGLGRGWFASSIAPLRALIGRQTRGGRGQALTNDQARNAAGYVKNIMNNAGAYVSNISGRVTNPLLYNGLKDTFTLMWGAYKSFDSLSRSDTRQLGQMLKSNMDIESIFRSFGAGAMFDKVAMSELSGDYKAILGQQLQGSKIATVDDNGNIKLQEAAGLEFKNYKELMGLAINPYSEFRSIDTRRSVFNKLMDDISGAVDNRGMPYFDPNTLNFLLTSLDQLKKWYGGSGGWLGQDYLFDKTLDPDPKTRSQKFLASLKNAQGIYGLSNIAYQNLGGPGQFGRELPAEEWFKNRIDAGNFATGGMVYASGGTLVNYQPRGTDTVPAMLTPGEFVVNRSATRQNLPLLKQINSGHLAEGGMAQDGGVSRLRWTPEGPKRVIEQRDNISPKLDVMNRNILNNASGIALIQKDVSDLKNTLKNIESPVQAISLLNSQVFELQNLAQAIPSFIYDQLITVLRNLWNTLGPAITQALGNPGAWPPAPFSKGGPVYASKGQLINFQPKGTDTVPAMLTPGEFVVNAKATKNNLGLLQSINQGVGGYSRGGVVYLNEGGISEKDNELLARIVRSPQQIAEFSQLEVGQDQIRQKLVEDSLKRFRASGMTGDSYQTWNRGGSYEGIDPTAALVSAAREFAPTAAAGAVGAYVMGASPFTGPAAPVVLGIGAIIAGVGTYMASRKLQTEVIEKNIKTAEGTLKDTLDKIAQENPVSSAVGSGVAGIATGGIPQVGTSGIKAALTLAGINTSLIGGKKLLENNLQFNREDMADILFGSVPGSSVGNIGDNLSRTLSVAMASLPVLAATRNSDLAAAQLRKSATKTSAQTKPAAASARKLSDVFAHISRPEQPIDPATLIYLATEGSRRQTGYKKLRDAIANSYGKTNDSTLDGFISSNASDIISRLDIRSQSPFGVALPADVNRSLIQGISKDRLLAAVPGMFSKPTRRGSYRIAPTEMSTEEALKQLITRKISALPSETNITDDILSKIFYDPEVSPLWESRMPDRLDYIFKDFSRPGTPGGRLEGVGPRPRPSTIRAINTPNPQSIRENIKAVFGSVVGSKREQIVRNVFNSVAGQLSRTDPNLNQKSLTALLDQQITTSGIVRTIADVANILGLPLDKIIPRDLEVGLQQAAAGAPLGTWNETDSRMSLLRPNKDFLNNNRVVAHEVGHSLLRRFGDDTYARFQNKMSDNIGMIREYMVSRPDIFGSYDTRTIGQGLYYNLMALLANPGTDVRSGIGQWATLYNQMDQLKLTPDQLKKIKDFYTKYSEGSTVPPDADELITIPGAPNILRITDITPNGSLDPNSIIRKRANAIKTLAVASDQGSAEMLPQIKEAYDSVGLLGPSFKDNLEVAREEFLTQMLQNIDKVDTRGLTIITELLDSTIGDASLFDASAFYERLRGILNQRTRIPGQPPPLPGNQSPKIGPRGENPIMRQKGGIIYASKGQLIPYEPRGTDTVPAMLTPGEFVVNRASTQKNLPLLKAINSGVGGYSDGGVVYLAAGGDTKSDAKNTLDIKNKITTQMRDRNAQQMMEANKNREGSLWAFSTTTQQNGKDVKGFLLRDPANPNMPAPQGSDTQTESLMANRLDQIFTIRARNEKEAIEAYKAMNNVGLLPQQVKPVSAQKALDEARKKWMQQPLYAKILDELSYQISLDPNQFEIFNPGFFNPQVNVDANTKPIIDAANAIDPNNPQSVALGVPVILTKLKPIIERINYLRKIVKNNEQALIVFNAAVNNGLKLNDPDNAPENIRTAFQNNSPIDIHKAQVTGGKAEIGGGEQILAKLGQNQTLFALGNDPRFQMMLSMIGSGPGVAVSTFERQVQQMAAPPKLLAGGGKVTYASNGQLINFAPRGTDTVPAMLTPGEFVVNREAAQKHLSLLHSINSNQDVLALNRGGYIAPSYFDRGGRAGSSSASSIVSAISPAILNITNQIKSAIQDAFKQAIDTLESSQDRNSGNGVSSNNGRDLSRIESFSNSLNNLANRLENISIPPEIQFTGKQDVNVNVNGMQNLNVDSEAARVATNALKNALGKLATNNPGTLDFNIDYS